MTRSIYSSSPFTGLNLALFSTHALRHIDLVNLYNCFMTSYQSTFFQMDIILYVFLSNKVGSSELGRVDGYTFACIEFLQKTLVKEEMSHLEMCPFSMKGLEIVCSSNNWPTVHTIISQQTMKILLVFIFYQTLA